MLKFSQFDRRRYPTIFVREGYREWLPSYDTTVEDRVGIPRDKSLAPQSGLNCSSNPFCFSRRLASDRSGEMESRVSS